MNTQYTILHIEFENRPILTLILKLTQDWYGEHGKEREHKI